MVNDRGQYTMLARLLALNNQVHDLENRLRGESLPGSPLTVDSPADPAQGCSIAQLQEEIDQGVRATLVACWLGMPDDPGP